MAVLIVPRLDEKPWPTLGPLICDFLEERAVYGPGSWKGVPYRFDKETRAIVYRLYEIYPRGHPFEGRRRFKRGGISVRKGLAKTEKLGLLAYAELHPEAPVRWAGWDAVGNPVGRPVAYPYIPLLSYNLDQTEELAYNALQTIVTEGPDADMFDVSKERILRIGENGREDGKALAVSTSPSARDGARTTFQGFDEPHRLYLPRLIEAHETMDANLPKRPLEDPWSLYVGTAGRPGQGSVAELIHKEAEDIRDGKISEPRLFYIHRDAGVIAEKPGDLGHDLTTMDGRIAAISEATGSIGEFGPGQFRDIAERWDRPRADLTYLARVWLNLWKGSAAQAFDPIRLDPNHKSNLYRDGIIAPGSFVTAGFDGARFRDATAIVITDIPTGKQQLWDLWERPANVDQWEIDEKLVRASVAELMATMDVWRFNADPPHWTESVGTWAGLWECVEEWWTNRIKPTAQAVRAYREAMRDGSVTYARDERTIHTSIPGETRMGALARHIAAAGKDELNIVDDDGAPLYILCKIDRERVFDAAMAALLSWVARLDALRDGAEPSRRSTEVMRIR